MIWRVLAVCCLILCCSENLTAQRVLNFPSDQAVGALHIRYVDIATDNMFDEWDGLGLAQGQIEIPDGSVVRLDVSGGRARDLSFLDRLPEDALSSLLISGPADGSQVKHIDRLIGLEWLYLRNTEITGEGFARCKGLPNLRFLNYDAYYSDGSGTPSTIAPSRLGERLTMHGMNDEQIECLLKFPKLEYLSLSKHPIGRRSMLVFNQLPELKVLRLQDIESSGHGFELLRNLDSLETLSIGNFSEGSQVNDLGAAKIAKITSLKRLSLRGSQITEQGLSELTSLPNLETLNIDDVELESPALRRLADAKSLKKLEFSGYRQGGWRDLASDLATIRSLETVGQNVFVNREGLEQLLTLPNLKNLSVMSDDSMDEFRGIGKKLTGCEKLESLSFHEILLDDEDVAQIGKLEDLRDLSLGYCRFKGFGLSKFNQLKKLKSLYLHFSEDDPIDLSQIPSMPSLEVLSISGPGLPGEREWFRKFPNVHLSQMRVPVVDEHLAGLTEWRKLRDLELSQGHISGEKIGELAKLRELNYLTIEGEFTVEELKQLQGLEKLQMLQISCASISANDIPSIERILPNTRILLYGQSR